MGTPVALIDCINVPEGQLIAAVTGTGVQLILPLALTLETYDPVGHVSLGIALQITCPPVSIPTKYLFVGHRRAVEQVTVPFASTPVTKRPGAQLCVSKVVRQFVPIHSPLVADT